MPTSYTTRTATLARTPGLILLTRDLGTLLEKLGRFAHSKTRRTQMKSSQHKVSKKSW